MAENELLPCPFCGGEVQIALSGDADYGYFWMVTRAYSHKSCKCRIFMESDLMEVCEGEKFDPKSAEAQLRYKELVELWNLRADDGEAVSIDD